MGGSEYDYRAILSKYLIEDVLGWKRKEKEGHFRLEDDRKDIICYDDGNPPFPAIIFETKKPGEELTLDSKDQLEGYLKEVGSAKYGVLTNGHKFLLYEYISPTVNLKKKVEINIDEILKKPFDELSSSSIKSLNLLKHLLHERYVRLSDIDVFIKQNKATSIDYTKTSKDIGYNLFIQSLKASLDGLTGELLTYFDGYYKRETYTGNFLKSSFKEWKKWRAYTGKKEKAEQAFCRETAYILLNRMIFARICEDKEISPSPKISGKGLSIFVRENEGSIENIYLQAINDAYREIEKHYEHFYQLGIFDWWYISKDKVNTLTDDEKRKQKELDKELDFAIKNILKRLNRFNFRSVNRDLLGHVYEDYLPKQERKELGEFYTPIEVVKYILDSVGYQQKSAIGDKKIIDPACGSGTFLTEITERLINHHLKKFGKINTNNLTADEAKLILEKINENIYGLDINPFATHISEINLLFKTIDLYNIVLKKYRDQTMDRFNIHCVDTLIMPNDDGSIKSNGQLTWDFFEKINGRAKTFSEDVLKADKIKEELKFHFVVGNPPYVRIQNLKESKNLYEIDYYETRHQNYDIYILFLERGLKWLTESGKLGYICPTRFTLTNYGEKIRGFLAEKYLIEQIIDFKETDVFDAATPYPCIITIKNEVDKEKIKANNIICARIANGYDEILNDIKKNLNDNFKSQFFDLFLYPQKQLDKNEWYLMPPDEQKLFTKIEERAIEKLETVSDDVFVGMQTSADPIYLGIIEKEINNHLAEFIPNIFKNDKSNKFKIEKDILKKVLKGKSILKWRVDWDKNWAIHPYKRINKDKTSLLTFEQLETIYPNTLIFFEFFNDNLEKRDSGKLKGKDNWYGHVYEKNLAKFESPKIMAQVLSNQNSFVVDPDGTYYFVGGGNAGGYGITIKDEYLSSIDDLYFFVALLNSKVLEFYEKHISVIFKGKYYSFGRKYIEKFPIVIPNKELKNEIIFKAKGIQELYKLESNLSEKSNDINNYLIDFSSNSKLLDISMSQELSKDIYKTSKINIQEETNQEGQTIYNFTFKRGHYIAFDSYEKAEFLQKMIQDKERITKTDLLFLNVPNNDDLIKVMEKYYNDIKQIQDINMEIETIQTELDSIICENIYNLDSEDLEIIDEFLKVW